VEEEALQALIDMVRSPAAELGSLRKRLDRAMTSAALLGGLINTWRSSTIPRFTRDSISDEDLERLQSEVATALQTFHEQNYWRAPIALDGVSLSVWRHADGQVSEQYEGSIEWRGAFWLTFARVLQHAADRLRRCPECKRMFFRNGRREFCPGCGGRSRARTFYRKHRDELLERRHAQRLERLQRQQKRKIKKQPRRPQRPRQK
jgi:hypothetical protein